jgi:ABC-type Fe3+/spermidine/putrescine transport system ATPase subunit
MSLELQAVTKRYGTLEVLSPLDLSVEPGEFLTLLGPSGSGKTTVLKLVGGFTAPSSGRVLFQGRDITRAPPNRRPFNTVFQDYALFPHMKVIENVRYGPKVQGRRGPEVARRIDETLEVVGLGDLRERYPDELSGGQKQRVALARAIVCEPELILLDEPLAALDAALRKQMQHFLKQIQRRIRTTFVFVTHDQDEALTLSDRIVIMQAGRIEQIGTPRDVYARPATAFVAGFIGENNLIAATGTADGAVETAIGRLAVPGRAAGPGLLALRPEALRLGPEGGNGLAGEIAEVVFGGALARVTVRTAADPETVLILHLPAGPRTDLPEPGRKVSVSYDPADAVFVGPI